MNDQELIVRYLAGDKTAFNLLVERYLKIVYSVAFYYVKNSPDAEDIAQDTFIKVMSNLKKFDLTKSFKPWVCQIAKNQALDLLKKKKAIPFSMLTAIESDSSILDTLSDPAPLASETIDIQDEKQRVIAAVKKLPKQTQAIFYLRYAQGMGFNEIAKQIGGLMNTVKSQSRRGLISLKKLLEEPKI